MFKLFQCSKRCQALNQQRWAALIPSVNHVCSRGEQMWNSGKGECLHQTEHGPKVISGTLARGFYFLTAFFSGTISKCCKQLERVLKTPSKFSFNTDKWKRNTADQPLVDLRVMLWSSEWFLLLNTLPEEWRESVPMFYFSEVRSHLKLWPSSIIFNVMKKN